MKQEFSDPVFLFLVILINAFVLFLVVGAWANWLVREFNTAVLKAVAAAKETT